MKSMSDFWVGIFVFLGIISIVFLSFRVGSYNSFDNKNAYSLIAKFDNLGGLKEGSPVKASGVTIGRVKSINFEVTQYKAKVKIYIEPISFILKLDEPVFLPFQLIGTIWYLNFLNIIFKGSSKKTLKFSEIIGIIL